MSSPPPAEAAEVKKGQGVNLRANPAETPSGWLRGVTDAEKGGLFNLVGVA